MFTLAAATLLAVFACERNPPTTSQPATQPAPAVPSLLAPASLEWSREEACVRLADDALGLSAAVRLVRLSEVSPACVPDGITDELLRKLRLVALNETYWALGLVDRRDERCLHAPVLITADGAVEVLAEFADEELLVLYVAEDPEVFPHVVLLPPVVMVVEDEVSVAMVLEPDQRVRFALRRQGDYPYVALILVRPGETDEVARYSWDPYEQAFFGPLIDVLPDPPGGKFRLDPEASLRLEPLGGELPEPKPLPQPGQERPQRPVADDRLPV